MRGIMFAMNLFFRLAIILYLLSIISCSDTENIQESNVSEPIMVTTSNVNTGNIYFDFLSSSEVSISDNWHIGIERDTSNYNMPSFVPGDVQIAVYVNMEFDNLVSLPELYMDDIQNDHTVFGYGGSYEVLSYDITVHKVSVTNPNYVYVVRSENNIYKLQFLEYLSGITTFKFAQLDQ